jgi:4-amino-4-deoxy-L-arabinose transferase-like glycosyltransferase
MNLQANKIPRADEVPHLLWLFFFLAGAVLLRMLSFGYSVIDHDESTYIVIARELLEGKIFYIDVWDTKPPGIFLIFMGILKLGGVSVVAVRVAAAIFIAFTAFFLFLAARRWGFAKSHSAIAGISYILMTSVHEWNFAANSEIFFNFFTALGLWFFLAKSRAYIPFLAGLAFGLGFIIKFYVLFDLFALWLFHLFTARGRAYSGSPGGLAKYSLRMALGFLLPISALMWYFASAGLFPEFRFATFELPGNYVSPFRFQRALGFFSEFHLVYLPFAITALLLIFRGSDRRLAFFAALWMGMVWIIVILPGKYFHHYYFQLLPPLAFLMAAAPDPSIGIKNLFKARAKVLVPVLLALIVAWSLSLQYRKYIARPDLPREIAALLEQRMSPEDKLYTNYSTILYAYLERSPLHRYVHPTLITDKNHREAVGIDVPMVMQNVTGQQPEWLVIRGKPHHIIQEYIQQQCTPVKEFGNDITVYHRRSASPHLIQE